MSGTRMQRTHALWLTVLLAALGLHACNKADRSTDDTSPYTECTNEELSANYTRYVEPFVSGSTRQSCSECHMTGIDMSIYAQDSACETMACMADSGAVDLDNPAQSAILAQILMGDPNSSVYDVETEHDAMLEWIRWNAECFDSVCGDIESPCSSGSGAETTGVDPIGDCSEEDLLAVFWDSVIADKGRCDVCHSDWAQEATTYGACVSTEDCVNQQECIGGICRHPGPYYAPHMFESEEAALQWNNPEDRQKGMNTMYNIVALGQFDTEDPLSSLLLTKPLLEGFQPLAIYGDGIEITDITAPSGFGLAHGGTSKFNFGYHENPPDEGVVDCRTDACGDGCANGLECIDDYCRVEDSLCDQTYVNYARLAEYFAECASE